MKKPAVDALETAAEWLKANEGESGESEKCKAVAHWLGEMAAEIRVNEEILRIATGMGYSKEMLTTGVMRKIKTKLVKKFAPATT